MFIKMRTVQEIRQEICSQFVANTVIQDKYELSPGLTFDEQFSKLSLEAIMFYIVAVAIWSLENILNISIKQQNAYIKAQKIHSLSWYSDFAKRFQVGDSLPWGEVEYETIDEEKQIVKYASVTKMPGGLNIKIAGLDGDELEPIDLIDFEAFKEYMFRISAAGDQLYYTNADADKMKLKLKVYYDALVLDHEGKRLDGTNDNVIEDAVNDYVKKMDFDGMLVPTYLIDHLQTVEGVVIPHLELLQTKYGSLNWMNVGSEGVNPHAGYVRLEELEVEYIAHAN